MVILRITCSTATSSTVCSGSSVGRLLVRALVCDRDDVSGQQIAGQNYDPLVATVDEYRRRLGRHTCVYMSIRITKNIVDTYVVHTTLYTAYITILIYFPTISHCYTQHTMHIHVNYIHIFYLHRI